MKITLSPQNRQQELTAALAGDVLTLNGTEYDFSQLNGGDVLPADAIDSTWLQGDVTRVGGEIELTLLLPHGSNAPEETRFPAPIHQTTDGDIPLPPYTIEEPEE